MRSVTSIWPSVRSSARSTSPSPRACSSRSSSIRRPGYSERHRRRRTSHAALISEILDLLAGRTPARRRDTTHLLSGPLTESETRVLRYLPTNLSAPEIAGELYLSLNTIRTHMRHLYSKLAVHTRAEAVERARALGLLAPSSRPG